LPTVKLKPGRGLPGAHEDKAGDRLSIPNGQIVFTPHAPNFTDLYYLPFTLTINWTMLNVSMVNARGS
jgi:hypothetical protein